MDMKTNKNYKANLKKWSESSKEKTITKKIYRTTQAKIEKMMNYEKKSGNKLTYVEAVEILADEGLIKRGIK
jgi:hypothetical protein